MTRILKGFTVVCMTVFLFACGGGAKDKDGKALKVGDQYVMTRQGLERVPFLKDKAGSQVEPGKQYVMTPSGLELAPALKDKSGTKLEVGYDYMMTEDGLKLVARRNIRGAVQDGVGKPLPGVDVSIEGKLEKTKTGPDGAFSLPFVEGRVKLLLNVPGLPRWCKAECGEGVTISRENYASGWDAGITKLPCVFIGEKEGKMSWATADGKYIDNGDGTVTDVSNGLMWEARVEKGSVPWKAAQEYAEKLALAGHSDWRLPTQDELMSLYQANIACGWHTPTLIVDAVSLWSSQVEDTTSAAVVNICTGKARTSSGLDEGLSGNPGTLAVRSVKK